VRALQPVLKDLLSSAPEAVRIAAIEAIERLGISEALPALLPLIKDTQLSSRVRLAALGTLATFPGPLQTEAIRMAAADTSDALRTEATRLQGRLPATEAIAPLTLALEKGSISEKQSALSALATLSSDRVNEVLDQWLDRLIAGQVPAEIQLDLMQAVAKRSARPLQSKIARYEASLPKDDPLAPYRVVLRGGVALAGKRIFLERQDAACAKCHKIGAEGGDVGPDLTGIGGKKDREYILESILLPNKQIAPGFENVLVTTRNGTQYSGVAKSENSAELVLNSAEDGAVTIKKADIKSRERGLSAMPEGVNNILSKEELRDLVEFLAQSK
jgi:quinoprotein glucose dehydrogenase